MTTAQITLAHVWSMAIAGTMLACVAGTVAFDHWSAGNGRGALKRLGVALFAAGVALHFWFFTARWMLIDAGLVDEAEWFYLKSHWTAIGGLIATTGVCLSLAAVNWRRSRTTGIFIVIFGFVATWAVGFAL